MKFIGIVSGVFTDKDTGEITKVLEPKENHIQDQILNATASGGGFFSSKNVVITDMNIPAQTRTLLSLNKYRVGNVITGLPNDENTYNYQPGIHLYRSARQFDPPTTDYTITAASMVSGNVAKGFVKFDTPCVQTTTEILTLYYQIQVRFDENWYTNPDQNIMTDREAWYLHQYMLGVTTLAQPATWSNPITSINPRKLKAAVSSQGTTSTTNLAVTGSMRAGIRTDYDIAENIGQLFTSIGTSSRSFMYPITNVPNAPVQGIFSHNSAADKPFYDAATGASGTGGLNIVTDNTYIPKPLAEYVKISITSTGQNGVASYKYSVRSSVGFTDNTFTSRDVVPPILSTYNTYLTKNKLLGDLGQTTPTNADYFVPMPYDKYRILMVHLDQIFIINLVGTDAVALDNEFIVLGDVNPRFLPTNIVDVKVTATKDLWVACKNTALYFISSDQLTLNVFDSTSTGLTGVTGCSGVDIGFNGRIWAYFQHPTNTGIYYSDDSGTSWTYTNSGIVGSATDNISLFADPSTVDGHLLLTYMNGTTPYGRWWNNSTSTNTFAGKLRGNNTDTFVPTDPAQTLPKGRSVNVSPNGVWVCSYYYSGTASGCIMEFGTTNRSGSTYKSKADPVYLDTDKNGNTVFFSQANGRYGPSYITESGSLNILTLSKQRHVIHLTDGIWLVYNVPSSGQTYYSLKASAPNAQDSWGSSPFRQFVWKDYGWDGSTWIRDYAGSKATHTAAEEIMTGVTVAFNDHGGAVDSYIDTDTYTFGLYDGIWMDGSTSFSFENYMFVKPSKKQTSVEVSTLPNTVVSVPYTPLTPTVPTSLFSDVTVFSGTSIYSGRTTLPKLICTVPQYIDNNKIYLHNENNIKATTKIKLYSSTGSSSLTGHFAIVRGTALGTAFDISTVPFGLEVIAGGSGHIVRAWESGVIKGSVDFITQAYMTLRITITNQREIVLEVEQNGSYYLVYKSPINTVILSDYHIEFKTSNPLDPGQTGNLSYNSITPDHSGNFIYLGNGLNEGAASTDFYRVDDKTIKIFIDGIESVNVGNNDTTTVLATNSYSLFPDNAMIRFSAADVGKTITAEYITLTDT